METGDKIRAIQQWLGTGSINIFGIQFSGKDTVGHQLATALDAMFISSGDVMRDIFTGKNATADDKMREAVKVGSLSGALMPTEEFKHMITARLMQNDLQGKPLVLSTVGRWIGEERPVMEALRASGHPTKAVILLNVSETEAWNRWQIARHTRNGGRHDDISQEKVALRIQEYKDKTLPVIQVYRAMGILLEVNGEQPRENVYNDTVDALYEFSLKA